MPIGRCGSTFAPSHLKGRFAGPPHATLEEFAADGYTHVEANCPRCRVIRLRVAQRYRHGLSINLVMKRGRAGTSDRTSRFELQPTLAMLLPGLCWRRQARRHSLQLDGVGPLGRSFGVTSDGRSSAVEPSCRVRSIADYDFRSGACSPWPSMVLAHDDCRSEGQTSGHRSRLVKAVSDLPKISMGRHRPTRALADLGEDDRMLGVLSNTLATGKPPKRKHSRGHSIFRR